MQKEEEKASSSTMDLWSIFLYGMRAPMTREKYRGRLAKFFDFIVLTVEDNLMLIRTTQHQEIEVNN
jgi:hypothetical protein